MVLSPPPRPLRWIVFARHCHCSRRRSRQGGQRGRIVVIVSPSPSTPAEDQRSKACGRGPNCLRCCDGSWRQRWLAMAAGGAAMASSASGDKKGGQLRSVSVFVTHDHRVGKIYANFADAAASHPACVMPQRREKY